MKTETFISKFDPCREAREWLIANNITDMAEAWEKCPRSVWMLWVLEKMEYNDKRALWLFACWCVRHTPLADGRTVWDLLTDPRSRNAVEVAERYANGEATDEELAAARAAWAAAWAARAARAARDAAWDAAWAARAAGDAARDAAWDAGDAAWAARDAGDAARDAAWDAGDAAWAARDAGDAARDAAWAAQADQLRKMISNPFAQGPVVK